MSTSDSSASREVEPGRLARFEDGDGPETSGLSLPPRRTRSGAETQERPRKARRETEPPKADKDEPDITPEPAEPAPGKGMEDKVRASNVHVPISLLEPLSVKCQETGLSHGEVIIVAIEQAFDRLPDLIKPPSTAGGSLFASRRSRTIRSSEGPLTPLNYRLRNADFQILDDLVAQTGASSRGHLISAALADYLTT